MKGLLVKRLESSFYAFRKTLGRAIRSHERFLEMLEGGAVYVSKDVSVYDLLDSDRDDVLDELAASDDDRVKKYAARLVPARVRRKDPGGPRAPAGDPGRLGGRRGGPQARRVPRPARERPDSQEAGARVHREQGDGGLPLASRWRRCTRSEVLSYSSEGGVLGDERLSVGAAREVIQSHFDPNKKAGRGTSASSSRRTCWPRASTSTGGTWWSTTTCRGTRRGCSSGSGA